MPKNYFKKIIKKTSVEKYRTRESASVKQPKTGFISLPEYEEQF